MIRTILTFTVLLVALSSCQTVPAERKNNCACLWEAPSGLTVLPEGFPV